MIFALCIFGSVRKSVPDINHSMPTYFFVVFVIDAFEDKFPPPCLQ